MKTVDTHELTLVIQQCLAISRDARFPLEFRNEMLALGKRLRGSLINLLTAQFANDLREVDEANRAIDDLNRKLDRTIADISGIADAVETANQVVGILDGLLKFAIGFV
jgi:hypothetical protein